MKKVLYFLPAIVIMVLIFLGSNDPASGEKSDFITKFIWKIIDSLFNYNHDYAQELGTSYIVRKIAHMTEYSFLNFSFYFALTKSFNNSFKKNIITSVLLSLLYSITDEFHQTFVPGRVGTYQDVLIDFSGMLLSSLILKVVLKEKL